MTLLLLNHDARRAAARRRRNFTSRYRPLCEGLEDRAVPSAMVAEHATELAALVHHHKAAATTVHMGKGTGGHPLDVSTHNQHGKQHPKHGHAHSGSTASSAAINTATAFSMQAPTIVQASPALVVAAPPTAATNPPAPQAAVAASTTASATPSSTSTSSSTLTDPQLLQLVVPPIDLNLLGLEVELDSGTTSGSTSPGPVTVTVSSESGNGQLLGNLLGDVGNLLNLQGVNTALNSVLGSAVGLLNQTTLAVNGVNTTGSLGSTTATTTTPVLDLNVAPIHVNLLGALVDTSAIHLEIVAHSGPGLVLGDLVTDLANLLNGPSAGSEKLTLQTILDDLNNLLTTVEGQLGSFVPALPTAAAATSGSTTGSEQVLSLTVPPIDLNLLGLILQTSQIQVNANTMTGNGDLLGNLLGDLLTTLKATPAQLTALSNDLDQLVGTVVNVLNASSLLPLSSLASLSPTLQQLATTNLTGAPFPTTPSPVLNVDIATNDGTPPVDVNLLGLVITTGDIQVQLLAQPGNNNILGNLVYNVANLLNPGGSLNILSVLDVLGL